MLYERKQLPELHHIKHLHDDDDNKFIKYDEMILDKTLVPYIFENNVMNEWLKRMQPLVSIMFDQMNIMKNFKNYMVDKYHWKQR
jgi:hypothetical protein